MNHVSRVSIFLEVVRHKSFSGAARTLGVTGPAISKQVQSLEDQLGVRLLHRTTRSVTLTEQGAVYAERARKAIEDLQDAERYVQNLREQPTGLIRVNVPSSFGSRYLSNPIAEFARTYPDVTVEVDYDDRHVDVISEGYDVAVRIGALEDSSLIARKIADCPIYPLASPSLLETLGPINFPEELNGAPGIIFTQHGNFAEWQFTGPDGDAGSVRLARKFSSNSGEGMITACHHGLGIALLPVFFCADEIEKGSLIRLLPNYKTTPERGIYAMFPESRYISTKVRLFVEMLVHKCRNLPWQSKA